MCVCMYASVQVYKHPDLDVSIYNTSIYSYQLANKASFPLTFLSSNVTNINVYAYIIFPLNNAILDSCPYERTFWVQGAIPWHFMLNTFNTCW